jgi:hypothetical protein
VLVGAGDFVAGAEEDDAGLVGGDLVFGEAAVGDDDREIAGRDEARGGTVDLDFAGTAVDDVGREAGAVVDVEDIDLLEFAEAGGLAEFAVHRDRALVFGVGGGDGGAVKLGLEEGAVHGREGKRMRNKIASASAG